MIRHLIVIFLGLTTYAHASHPSFNSQITPTWNILREYKQSSLNLATQKAICIGMITLQTRTPLRLSSFTLQWHGPELGEIYASIYQKRKHDDKAALNSNHICDGFWSQKLQQIIFPMNQKISARQHYYLVISTKNTNEQSLKSGRFDLLTSTQKNIHTPNSILHKKPHVLYAKT